MAKRAHSVHTAKTNLSRLVERARAGEEVIIAKGQTPVVRLVSIAAAAPCRRFGALRGRAAVTAAFFEPLPAAELDAWGQEGRERFRRRISARTVVTD